ncbi:hypothetical protein MANES_01G231900v8 [Manihot esculenta]|uniref:Uncharacterized protein n=1 Tax=Manihot esculenta TaxID=3983 RepID=A0ACB7IFV6_MANES|nr:hypothetical protein MANES_01G231900v8 [Manihot esculenta]
MTRGIPFPRFKQLGVTYWASSPTPFNSSLNFFLFLLLKIYLPVGSGWRFWWLRWTVGRQRRGHKAEDMASKEEASRSEGEEYVYRISTAEEWESLQKDGAIFGGDLDKSSGFIHLSKLNQLGDGLIYEVVDGSNSFPHFYGPSRSFVPLPLDAVVKAEKITVSDGQFICSLLN